MARRPDKSANQLGWGLIILGLVLVVSALTLVTGEDEARTFISSSGEFHGRVSRTHHPTILGGTVKWLLGCLGAGLGLAMIYGGARVLRSGPPDAADGH